MVLFFYYISELFNTNSMPLPAGSAYLPLYQRVNCFFSGEVFPGLFVGIV